MVILKMAADGLQINRWFRHAAQPWRGWSRVKKADFLAPHCKPSAIGRQQDIAAIFRAPPPSTAAPRRKLACGIASCGRAAGRSIRNRAASLSERGFDLFRFARLPRNASSPKRPDPRISSRTAHARDRWPAIRRGSDGAHEGMSRRHVDLGDRDDHHAGDTQGGEPRQKPHDQGDAAAELRHGGQRLRALAGIAASGPIQPTGSWIFGQPWRMNAAPHHQPEHKEAPGNPATRSFRNKTVAWMRAFPNSTPLPSSRLGTPLTANTTLLAPKLELGSELTGIIHFGHPSSLWSVLELPDKLPKWPKSTRIDIGCSRVRHGRMDREIAKKSK